MAGGGGGLSRDEGAVDGAAAARAAGRGRALALLVLGLGGAWEVDARARGAGAASAWCTATSICGAPARADFLGCCGVNVMVYDTRQRLRGCASLGSAGLRQGSGTICSPPRGSTASVDVHDGVVRQEGMAGGRAGDGVAEVGNREAAKQKAWDFGLSSLPRLDVPSAKAVLIPIW
ncbi:hypothetical protein DFH08DRAFT_815610 [Mycena albidolilacea]|uniref:Uncharacterized protein n=1 Tax=Mycena albidolilacea TaxID=1033008 RepID=A0AAD7EKG1_9AGAR|nr:hypothetical protein DFH08DRAFT_815610 [Mycena albidolilacea]